MSEKKGKREYNVGIDMQDLFENYIQSISSKFFHEETSEMGYRTDFEILIKGIFESIKVKRIDHDARAEQGNKPDFVVLNYDIPILYIEAKDIDISLDKVEKSEQMSRYYGYANLVLTDYVEFRFYRNGLPYGDPIRIADCNLKNRTLTPILGNYEYLAKTLVDFTQSHKEPIKSATHLAKIMGGKGQRLRNNVRHLFNIKSENNDDLEKLYKTIKELLVNDLTPHSFADMYAQTLIYGLFVARFYDKTLNSFTRQEARELIPNSNRFLKRFFDHIVGTEFKSSLRYIVDELCEVFSHANVAELMKEYFKKDLWGEIHKGQDPVIHFYEDFLKEYDPELRKKMGAYYTPLPVVKFIIHSVDHLLKKEFGLMAGLADISRTKDNLHKVQILDPAVGTGTFLSETIEVIHKNFLGQEGRWPGYVHYDLLPRLHGFELMMTPYTIAHLKLGIELRRTGFWDFRRRLGIYLTNSLEENPKQEQMFAFGLAESIAEESKEAAIIKNETPIMIVIGNPPYSISSSNKGEWIQNLIKDYKTNLNEKNMQPLSDDYIKFIRLAEHFIEKNQSGIVAMITNNSFIDGIIHRQMRKHLLETFDILHILNLHGNARKGETDQNIFNIMQGVSISIFVKNNKKKAGKLGEVFYSELFGSRADKFKFLDKNNIYSVSWNRINIENNDKFEFVNFDKTKNSYENNISLIDLFKTISSGVTTSNDSKLISFNYNEGYVEYGYKPFDVRFLDYYSKLNLRPRKEVMQYLIGKDNLSLVSRRSSENAKTWAHIFVSRVPIDGNYLSARTYQMPLYIYRNQEKTSNLNEEIVGKIEHIVGKASPENIFDYIYAVLHSPSYREKYKEFLKIDFPRVPYPKDIKTFKKLVSFGAELRLLHLLESSKASKFITTYPIAGSDVVGKPIYKNVNVLINESQYFGKLPESVWNFYIGGYQPVQKWLKDRKGRKLTNEDIEHYQKIVSSLVETERIMKKIDKEIKF